MFIEEFSKIIDQIINNEQDVEKALTKDYKQEIFANGYIGLGQINLTAGDLSGNSSKIAKYIKLAEKIGLDAIVFPKNTLLGDELKDFVPRYPFILNEEEKYLNELAKITGRTAVIISYLNKKSTYSIAILRNEKIEQIHEDKDFISSKFINDGVEYYIKPASYQNRTNTEFYRNNDISELSKKTKRPIVEVNQVGAIDCKSFAGFSCAYDENGKLIARAKGFEEQLLILNPFRKVGKIYDSKIIEPKNEFSLDYESDLERTYKTLVQGIKDYFNKCGLKRAVLGLSGGLDSTICAVLLSDALGAKNVYGVSMPSKLTSLESKSDAEILAKNLGIGFQEMPIKPMYDTTDTCLQELFNKVQSYWNCRYSQSFTPDNIQARSRAIYLWGIANEFESCIPIATSDKSELYMGYATINGDMSGGYAPIADITKTKLFALGYWMNKNRAQKNSIPESILVKRPGAELAIDPNTGKTLCAEDALMPYEFMDEIIWRIENYNQSYMELLNSKFIYENKVNISYEQKKEWLDKFYRRMSTALYKGFILPPSIIVEEKSINKTDYIQPITSCRIDYKH